MSSELEEKARKITNLFKLLKNKKELLVNIIRNKIAMKVIKVQSAYKGFFLRKNLKQNLLINQLLYQRHSLANKIQQKFLSHFYISEFNKILDKEKKNYSIYYISETKGQDIKIQIIFSNNYSENFSFEYCNARKIYVTYIDKNILKPDIYLCSFIVNGIIVCDSRYPTVYSGKSFFNKIDFSQLNYESDDDDEEEVQMHFFNLKNIDHYRKKIKEDIEEDKKTSFSKNKKGSNLSLTNLRKTEVKQAKKLLYVKSLSELLKKPPLKSILRRSAENSFKMKMYIKEDSLDLCERKSVDSLEKKKMDTTNLFSYSQSVKKKVLITENVDFY